MPGTHCCVRQYRDRDNGHIINYHIQGINSYASFSLHETHICFALLDHHDTSSRKRGKNNKTHEALVTLCFGPRELPRKQELVDDRGQLVSLFIDGAFFSM